MECGIKFKEGYAHVIISFGKGHALHKTQAQVLRANLTMSFQSIKVVMTNPVKALRSEWLRYFTIVVSVARRGTS